MFEILRIGENCIHDNSFYIDRPNGHPVYLLLLIKTPARVYVENEWCNTQADTAIIFRPGQKHLYCSAAGSSHPAYMNSWAHISSAAPLLPTHFPFGKPILLHQADAYYNLFHLITTEFYGCSNNRSSILNHLMSALLKKLETESNSSEFPELYYQLVTLREKIFSSPTDDWTVKRMSSMLNISEGYLHAVYKKYFSTTCMQDVICARIQYACDYLTSTNLSVEEIAESCGYHYTEYFIRQFKKQVQMTPLEYKKNALKENTPARTGHTPSVHPS